MKGVKKIYVVIIVILLSLIVIALLFKNIISNKTVSPTSGPVSTESSVSTSSSAATKNTQTVSPTASASSTSTAASSSPQSTSVPNDVVPNPDQDDPQKNRAEGNIPADFGSTDSISSQLDTKEYTVSSSLANDNFARAYVSGTTGFSNTILADTLAGDTLTHDTRFVNNIKSVGIDVSQWQGTIDWQQVSQSGVQFAIIRCGYRGYTTGEMRTDPEFERNLTEAKKYGIQVGVYFFSMAINESEAAEEANYALNLIGNTQLDLPIYMDTEFAGQSGDRLLNANLSDEEETNCVLSFCNTIKSHGYSAGQYASKSYFEYRENVEQVVAAGYRIWLAHYTDQTDYTGVYDIWQHCGSNGEVSIPGIKGYVDCNVWYKSPTGVTTYDGVDYSSIYDFKYYLRSNPDVEAVFGDNDDVGVLRHFVSFGMSEGRLAKSTFDVRSYRNAYPDLRAAYGTNWRKYFLHYMNFGQYENRSMLTGVTAMQGTTTYNGVDYSLIYDFQYYLQQNPDVQSVFGDDDYAVLKHFVSYGMDEGRIAKSTFDVRSYKNAYEDLRNVFGDNWRKYYMHYINFGQYENRTQLTGVTSPITTPTAPPSSTTSGTTVYNGIDYSPVYDFQYYLQQNPDVKAVFGEDPAAVLKHFATFGVSEGRIAKDSFNVNTYKNSYDDLRAAYGDNWSKYYMHYINFGQYENRIYK